MNMNEWRDICHTNAVLQGFHDEPRTPLEEHALIGSEVGEATDAVRSGLANAAILCADPNGNLKPEGECYEVADIIIRCLDYCGKMKWDIEKLIADKVAYNKTRAYKHGKVK